MRLSPLISLISTRLAPDRHSPLTAIKRAGGHTCFTGSRNGRHTDNCWLRFTQRREGGMNLYNGGVRMSPHTVRRKRKRRGRRRGEKGVNRTIPVPSCTLNSSQSNPDWREKKGRKLEKKVHKSSRRPVLLRHRDWVSSDFIGPRSITTSMQTPSPADANIAVLGRAGGHVIAHATAIARYLHGVAK